MFRDGEYSTKAWSEEPGAPVPMALDTFCVQQGEEQSLRSAGAASRCLCSSQKLSSGGNIKWPKKLAKFSIRLNIGKKYLCSIYCASPV